MEPTAATFSSSIKESPITYDVKRPVLLQSEVDRIAEFKRKLGVRQHIEQAVRRFKCATYVRSILPILVWLPAYNWRRSLSADTFAGIIIAVMHIPQGMAYGLLAGLSPSVGLYMAIYPALVYVLMGTSRHTSIGTLSISSIMTQRIVEAYTKPPNASGHTAEQVASALAFVCGLQMCAMHVLQAGMLTSLLSESLIKSFTMATAAHVIIAMVTDMFGLKIECAPPRFFALVYSAYRFAAGLPRTNVAALVTSLVCMAAMLLVEAYVRPLVRRYLHFNVPVELLAVCGGTFASYALDMHGRWQVELVGHIPLGLPMPKWPLASLFGHLMWDALGLTVICYALTMSIGEMLARQHGYEVRTNQELLAMGVGNMVGGCFSCLPMAGSISRSIVLEQAGGQTQLVGLVSAVLICFVLLWIGPVFELLPRCILAVVILVAIRKLYKDIVLLARFHRESWLHSLTWVVTFVTVTFIDIVIGLVAGIAISLFSVYLNGIRAQHCALGHLPGTGNLYACLQTHAAARQLDGLLLFRYIGALIFTRTGSFKKAILAERRRRADDAADKRLQPIHTVVIDLACVPQIDASGVHALRQLQLELRALGVGLVVAAPNDRVKDAFGHGIAMEAIDSTLLVYASLHDAVVACAAGGAALAADSLLAASSLVSNMGSIIGT